MSEPELHVKDFNIYFLGKGILWASDLEAGII